MVGLHSYMDMLQVKFDVGLNSFIEPTIGDKSVAPLPCPLHSKLGCLLFSVGS